MASDGGGKIRNKRQFEANKPYNRRKSLMARVGDTVKDMLSPSWLVDLVSTVKKKTPPQSPNLPDQQQPNSSHFDVDGEVPVRREINRVREEAGETSLGNSFVPTVRTGSHTQPSISEGTAFTSSQLPFQGFKPFPQTMVNGDDQSENSEYSVSTSGCSSMIPHPDKKDYQRDILQMNESKLHQFRNDISAPSHTKSTSPADALEIGKSLQVSEGSFLWSSSKPKTTTARSQPQPPARAQRPAFNLSAFTLPTSPKDKSSIFGSSYLESPYYPGKTTYGGASSHRRNRLQASAPYQQTGARKQVKARPLNNADLGGVTSSTARKILDSLEKMSTPLSDAKKIPASYKSFELDSPLSFTPSLSRRRKFGSTSRSSLEGPLSRGPPVDQINTPRVASQAPNRALLVSPSVPVGKQSPPKPSQDPKNQTPSSQGFQVQKSGEEVGSHTGGKMKRDRGTHYSSKRQEEPEVEVPNLPTSVTLSVSNMPKIDLTSGPPVVNSRNKPNGATENGLSPTFKFSSPIERSVPESLGNVSPVKFEFSAPIHVNKQEVTSPSMTAGSNFNFGVTTSSELRRKPLATFVQGEIKSPVTSELSGGIKIASQLKQGSVMDFLSKTASSTPKVDGVGISPASSLKQGSVMDILGKGSNGSDKKADTGTNSLNMFKKPAGSWECSTCLIQNKPSTDKCVACEASKPVAVPQTGSSPPQVTRTPGDSSLASMFKKPAGTWECSTCMVQNAPELSRCCACETPKPGQTKPGSSATGPSLANMFKKPEGSWECPTCMIRNKPEITKCPACQTAKPENKSVPQSQDSGSSLAGLFKKPTGTWECPTCMIQNKPDNTKCAACETPKPGAQSTPAKQVVVDPSLSAQFKKPVGSWECDTCMVVNKAEAHRCVACDTPKPGAKPPTGFTSSGGFKFASGGGFTLGGKSSSTDTDSKTAALGSFTMPSGGFKFKTTSSGDKDTSTPAGGGFKFSIPAPSGDSQPATGGFKFGGDLSKPNKDISGFKSADTKEDESSKPSISGGFKFGENKVTEPGKISSSGVGGFKFNNNNATTPGSSSTTGGFSADLPVSKSITDKPLSGGFKFGSETNNSVSANITSDSKPVLGGFNFPQTTGEKKPEDKASSGGAFAFKQTSEPHKSDSDKPTVGGFSFGQGMTKTDGSNQASTALSNTENKPAVGGFTFGKSETKPDANKPVQGSTGVGLPASLDVKAADSKPALGGFSFAATSNSGPSDSLQSKPLSSSFVFEPKTDKTGSSAPATNFSFGNSQKPEAAPSTTASTGLFAFGASKDSTSAFGALGSQKQSDSTSDNKAGTFQFGAGSTNKPATAAAGSASLFTFGGNQTGPNSNQPLGAGFGTQSALGAGASKRGRDDDDGPGDAKRAFGSNAGSSGNFSFGQSSSTAATTTPSFAFGQSNSASTSTAPTFNFTGGNQTSSSSASTNFAFGQNASSSTPAFGATPSTTTSSSTFSTTVASFNFASSATANQGGLFQFSANNQTPSNPPSGSAPFSFGQSGQAPLQPAAAAPAPAASSGFNFSASAAPNFNFGSQGGAPSFQFSASSGPTPGTPASGSNPFSATGSGAASQRRTIKKAVRRRK